MDKYKEEIDDIKLMKILLIKYPIMIYHILYLIKLNFL